MHALFSESQIREVVLLDLEYGYNFEDISDSFEALNALPRRSMRKIVQRITNRKPLASTMNTGEGTTKLEKALQKKYTTKIFTQNAEFPPFD